MSGIGQSHQRRRPERIHCAGTCADVTRLRAPYLNPLDLKLDIIDAKFDQLAHHDFSQALLRVTPTLRSLQLDYKRVCTDLRLTSTAALAPIALVSKVLKPLFGRLDIDSFTLWCDLRVLLTDDQVIRVAQR